MINDPIVEEVYKIRENLLNVCGGDLAKLVHWQKSIAVPAGMKSVSAEEVCRLAAMQNAVAMQVDKS